MCIHLSPKFTCQNVCMSVYISVCMGVSVCLSVCVLGVLLKEKNKLFRLLDTMAHFGHSDLVLIILILQDL